VTGEYCRCCGIPLGIGMHINHPLAYEANRVVPGGTAYVPVCAVCHEKEVERIRREANSAQRAELG
jgi:hypothetical protein